MEDISIINKALFPVPEPYYTLDDFKHNDSCLIWLPLLTQTDLDDYTEKSVSPETVRFPAILRQDEDADRLIVFFHGNGTDAGASSFIWRGLQTQLAAKGVYVHVLAVEYPGYGVFKHWKVPSETSVLAVAEAAMIAIDRILHVPASRVIVMGRSIGTGPAINVASRFPCSALVTVSAYTSIRSIVKSLMGTIISKLIFNRFDSAACIASVEQPTLFIHGERDNLIPCEESQNLYELSPAILKRLVTRRHMDHNRIDIRRDIAQPFLDFINAIDESKEIHDLKETQEFPSVIDVEFLREIPQAVIHMEENGHGSGFLAATLAVSAALSEVSVSGSKSALSKD